MTGTPPLMLSIDEYNALQPLSDKDLLIDVGSAERYGLEHLPGAINVTPGQTQAGPPTPGLLPSDDQLETLFRRIGLRADSHVFVYDDEGGGWAGRFIWMLDEIGHTAYSYIDGGLSAWKSAGLELSSESPDITPSEIKISSNKNHTISIEELLEAHNKSDVAIWDARSPLEHTGEKANSKRGGRIPGAINLNWTDLMDKSRDLRLLPLEELQEKLNGLGLSKDKTIYTHCQSHHRSGLTYLLMKILGYDSYKAYAGSWGEWGNRDDTPVQVGKV